MQELLRQSLAEQKLHLQLLSQSLAASSLAVKEKHRLPGHSSQVRYIGSTWHHQFLMMFQGPRDIEVFFVSSD